MSERVTRRRAQRPNYRQRLNTGNSVRTQARRRANQRRVLREEIPPLVPDRALLPDRHLLPDSIKTKYKI